MKLFIVIYVFGEVTGAIPVGHQNVEQCKYQAAALQAKSESQYAMNKARKLPPPNRKGRDVWPEDVERKCEFHTEWPKGDW